MTEYMVLLIGDTEHWWTEATAEEKERTMAVHDRFSTGMAERGHAITGGAELHRASAARSIAANTETVTEGPFVESAEQVGGFYLVESDDLDDLMERCKMLAATGDAVEVRRCVSTEDRAS